MYFLRPKRSVSKVFIHCTASEAPAEGEQLKALVHKWHVKERGFDDIGYHFLIDKVGAIIPCRSLEQIPAAQSGHNKGSVAIAVHGATAFSPESLLSLEALCAEINDAYLERVTFHGHCEVSPKACPVFNYKAVLRLGPQGHMQ